MKTWCYQLFLCLLVYVRSQAKVYEWNSWGTWEPCSVSCDKGVKIRKRECLGKSVSSKPRSRHVERRRCLGSLLDYQFCYPGDCDENNPKILGPKVTYYDGYRSRAEQCAKFDRKSYNGTQIRWKPHMKDYLDQCRLYCRASDQKFYARLKEAVKDGTPCGQHFSKVCIKGKCKKRPRGCRSLDAPCIVEKRLKVLGVFNSTNTSYGYNVIATIPKGATDINIAELTKSKNYLALKDHIKDTNYLNGGWIVSLSKTFEIAGSTVHYKRNGRETIRINGPLERDLDVQLINQGDTCAVLYSFYVALKKYKELKAAPVKNGQHYFFPDEKKTSKAENISDQNDGTEASRTLQKERSQSPSLFRYPQQPPASQGKQPVMWYGSSWVQFGGEHSTTDDNSRTTDFNGQSGKPSLLNQKIFVPNQHRVNGGQYPNTGHPRPYEQTPPKVGNRQGDQGGHWGYPATQLNNNEKQFYTSEQGKPIGRVLQTFVWRTSGFTVCSASCAGGFQSEIVHCTRSDTGETVLDIKCDGSLRPPERRRVCNLHPCPPRWVPQEWKECSKTCGEGEQVRDLMCEHVIDRNGEKVTAMLPVIRCPVNLRPDVMRKCLVKPCPALPKPRWLADDWGNCSVECSYGIQKRVVTCKDYQNITVGDTKCSLSAKPSPLRSCYLGLCKAAWYKRSYWPKCSKSCGGGVQNRPVICARVDGSVLNEIHCRGKKNPGETQTCQNQACKGVWMTSEWSECSSDCGTGLQERAVICMRYTNGRYQETNEQHCSIDSKPVVRKECNLKECEPSWFITTWTECSVTCGNGYQTRHVSCLDKNGKRGGGCKAWERPPKRRACHPRACPGGDKSKALTQPIPSCSNKIHNATCNFVKKLRLCGRAHYKRLCCETCGGK